MWVGLIQYMEGLNKTKSLNKRKFTCSDFIWAGTSVFSAFGLRLGMELNTIDSPGSQSFELGLELYHYSPVSPTGQIQILGLLSFHNFASQFLIIHTFINLDQDILYWLCFSWEPKLIQAHLDLPLYVLFHPSPVFQEDKSASREACWGPGLQAAKYEFHHSYLVKESHRDILDSKNRKTDSPCWMEWGVAI